MLDTFGSTVAALSPALHGRNTSKLRRTCSQVPLQLDLKKQVIVAAQSSNASEFIPNQMTDTVQDDTELPLAAFINVAKIQDNFTSWAPRKIYIYIYTMFTVHTFL